MRYSITGATVDQVRSVGATDIKEARSTGIIFATLTEEQASRLRSQGCTVDKVGGVRTAVMPPIAPPAPVAGMPIYSPQELVWVAGLEQLRNLRQPPLYGDGLTLALVDTGVRETHEQVKERVVYSKNYTSGVMQDGFNHGTATCSVAVAVAPLCNILNLKVLDDKGEGTEEEVVLAIDDCIDFHDNRPEIAPQVINLSLGSPDDGNPNNILRVACRAAIEKGIWIIAAAGNSGPNPSSLMTPACERYVVAIGSARYISDRKTFVVSDFSSRGPTLEGLTKPDMVMFGENIDLASSSSDTATVAKSGTSFSTPFLSAAAVIYMEGWARTPALWPGPGAFPELVELPSVSDALDKYLGHVCTKPVGAPVNKDNDYGYGLLFGPYVLQTLGVSPAVDISALLLPMVSIMMLGVVMKSID